MKKTSNWICLPVKITKEAKDSIILANLICKKLFLMSVCLILLFSSCKDDENTVNKANIKPPAYKPYALTKLPFNSIEKLVLDDYLFKQLGVAHNYYLEKFIENFDFDAPNYGLELANGILNANIPIDNLPLEARYKIINSMNLNKNMYKSGNTLQNDAEYYVPTIANLIETINKAELTESATLVTYINEIYDKVITDSTLNYNEFCNKLDGNVAKASKKLDSNSIVIFKTFIETLKASGYFWLPTVRGGSGIGYLFLEKIWNNTEKNSTVAKIGNGFQKDQNKPSFKDTHPGLCSALLSDACAMSVGMIGVAVMGTLFPPVGAAALICVAAEAAAGSALMGGIDSAGNKGGSSSNTGGGKKGGGSGGGNGGSKNGGKK